MKGTFLVILSLVAAIGAGAQVAGAQGGALQAKHASEGVQCADCHKVDKPTAAASVEACLGCHGGYDGMALRTKSLHANPHDSHLGRMPCLNCHHVHTPAEIVCLTCHADFDLKEK